MKTNITVEFTCDCGVKTIVNNPVFDVQEVETPYYQPYKKKVFVECICNSCQKKNELIVAEIYGN